MTAFLQQLKDKLNFIGFEGDYNRFFANTATLLMNKFVIRTSRGDYRITEIEFYLFDFDSHRDILTYPRIMDAGRWFFHDSGVDLTFTSNHNRFGGILIRGIKNTKTDAEIKGPLNCVYELWRDFDALSGNASEYPVLAPLPSNENKQPTPNKRVIKVAKNEREDKVRYWIKTNQNRAERMVQYDSEYSLIRYDNPEPETSKLAVLVIDSKYRFTIRS